MREEEEDGKMMTDDQAARVIRRKPAPTKTFDISCNQIPLGVVSRARLLDLITRLEREAVEGQQALVVSKIRLFVVRLRGAVEGRGRNGK